MVCTDPLYIKQPVAFKFKGPASAMLILQLILPDAASMLHSLSYRMSHPCIVRCLQTITVLTVCMDKLVCRMIKQSTRIGILVLVNQTSLQIATSSMTHCQCFHLIFHGCSSYSLPIQQPCME